MTKLSLKLLISAAVIVSVSIVFAISTYWGTSPSQPTEPDLVTLAPVPPETKVPSAGEYVHNRDIGAPTSVAPSESGAGVTVRSFGIRAFNNVYDPNTIVVYKGDAVSIKFSAVDKEYDITVPDMNLHVIAKKQETATLEFLADKVGKYLYYCDLCGGINSSTRGYIIIAPKDN